MKLKVKGFTLVECIVAMALIAVASLFMAQIYASLSTIERGNKMLSTSLEEQMMYAERELAPADNVHNIAPAGSSSVSMTFERDKSSKSKMAEKFKLYKNTTNPVNSDIELVVYEAAKDTTTANGVGQSYSMDKTIRYKIVISKKT